MMQNTSQDELNNYTLNYIRNNGAYNNATGTNDFNLRRLNNIYNLQNNNILNTLLPIQFSNSNQHVVQNFENLGNFNNSLNYNNLTQINGVAHLKNFQSKEMINFENEGNANINNLIKIYSTQYKMNEENSNNQANNSAEHSSVMNENNNINSFADIISEEDKKEDEYIDSSKSNSNERQKYFKCNFKGCDKIFHKESSLNDHRKCHTKEKPHKCDFPNCSKTFSQLGNLRKHQIVHTGKKIYKCEHQSCGKSFSALYNLKIHHRSHTGDKPYKCSIDGCGRDFYDKGNLKYHENTSHATEIKKLPFVCEHLGCNMRFKSKKDKLLHHNTLEPECKNERNNLIMLIAYFKRCLLNLYKLYNISENDLLNDSDYINLKQKYIETEQKLIDSDFFYNTLGENFIDMPKNLDN